ncbi:MULTISPECIES: hypothetical protein [Nocardiopsis]|jgi:hypothetical protein|uniref:Uncharacterized protein n=2 Tax=Nocardiopsis TaxID=2013 RepID=D7B338_NOCDD|nr:MULTISPECIES: hypothetical protein [Nocardiopsis]ADH68728.1 conserved hypothetical protein [Nocardiopsis dassonvillei subsp. dassonvillei DSM 43111]APC36788.1 hypothetical protein A9R04_19840 [Nocardiopsis dassonvillei]ASU59728.1 hypothetical protein CGQ36_20115 [Nocardiopsis dassonvillei]MCP3013716.1 hypothetical protein [Nocardiopsis dassonvillei]NKY98123.1 hypothetical protein [Nocardiopsis alborubida]
MREFALTLHVRIHDSITALRRAHALGDDDLASAQAGEVEDLVEIAARNGIDIAGGYSSLSPVA